MRGYRWFDVFFIDEAGKKYRTSTLQENANAARNFAEIHYKGMTGKGTISPVCVDCEPGESIPFQVGKGEHGGDAS